MGAISTTSQQTTKSNRDHFSIAQYFHADNYYYCRNSRWQRLRWWRYAYNKSSSPGIIKSVNVKHLTQKATHISNYSFNWQRDRIKKFHSLKREGREISVQTLSSKYDIDERQYFYYIRFWFRSLRMQKLFSDIENNAAFMSLFIQCEYVKHRMKTTNMINQKFGTASVHLYSDWIGLVGNHFAIVKLLLRSKAHHPRSK